MKDYSLKINGHNYDVQIDDVTETSSMTRVIVNGETYEVAIGDTNTVSAVKPQVAPVPKSVSTSNSAVPAAPAAVKVQAAAPSAGYSVKCPLPGTILSIKVTAGDKVAAGQTLVVLEAMKMENNIDADRAGVVKQVLVQQGATVMEGDTLIVIE